MNDLVPIFEKYSLDKLYNKYHDLYFELFKDKKSNIYKVLEVGIGTTDENLVSSMHYYQQNDAPNYIHGNSLRCWRDYFPNAKIYGIDIDENTMFTEDRIETFCSNSMDKIKVTNIMNSIGKMDVIIEDGLHIMEANIKTLEILLPFLNEGGVYVMEDVNQFNDWYVDDMLKDERFLNIVNGYNYEVHSGFNADYTRVIVIKKI